MDNKIGIQPFDGLDETDIRIIEALQKDGRVAFAQVAEQLGVSPGMIRQRYNRLVEQGVLKVVAITNPLRMGYKTMAMIGIRVEGSKLLCERGPRCTLQSHVDTIVIYGQLDRLTGANPGGASNAGRYPNGEAVTPLLHGRFRWAVHADSPM